MADNKRYYWLKLREGFFREKEIKKLRKIAGGDTYTIIYLKMLLKSLSNNGVLYFDGVENSFIAELALDIDEEEENVAITVQYLLSQKILIEINEEEYLLTTCTEMVGSETASTIRSRKSRNNQKLLQCNTTATKGNTEIDIDFADCQQIIKLYNDTCVSLPRLENLTKNRIKAIKETLKKYSLEDFKKLFVKAEASSYLKGNNKDSWTANLDWLIKEDNMVRVLEGIFDDKPKKGKRIEPVPKWATKERQDYDIASLEAKLVCNSPELQQRAEALKQSLTNKE